MVKISRVPKQFRNHYLQYFHRELRPTYHFQHQGKKPVLTAVRCNRKLQKGKGSFSEKEVEERVGVKKRLC